MMRDLPFRFLGVASNRVILLMLLLTLSILLLWRTYQDVPSLSVLENELQPTIYQSVSQRVTSLAVRTTSQARMRCKKKTNVSFLKVHKAGSTTVMNIFLRFARENGLNIVLPSKYTGFGFNYLGYGKTLSRDRIVPLPNNETYNILCNHVVYNRAAFRAIMPEDTVYVGILREPTSHFKSAAVYYGFKKALGKYAQQHNISEDVNMVHEYLKNPKNFKVPAYFVHNRMSFDLGLPPASFENETFIQSYLNELERDYSLMMLMEDFDKSLVLLRRLLCWDLKDILYIPLNKIPSSVPPVTLTEEDQENLKTWNNADYILYHRFSDVFYEKADNLSDDFLDEVAMFKTVQANVKQYCDTVTVTSSPYLVGDTPWSSRFYVTVQECRLMKEPELQMMTRFIKNGWEKYNRSLAVA